MDEIDKRIIEILKSDGSLPLSKVADIIGIPRPTVYLRFNKLKESGIVKGFNLVMGKEHKGPLMAAMVTVKDYILSEMGERTMKNLGRKLAVRQEVVFAAQISKNKLVIFWQGESFHPSQYEEIIEVKDIEGKIFKS